MRENDSPGKYVRLHTLELKTITEAYQADRELILHFKDGSFVTVSIPDDDCILSVLGGERG